MVDCVREGPVQLLEGDSIDGQPKWIKCKLALLSLPAGHVIEFYNPPKNLKARTGMFCQSVCELRETSDLEMPDMRNTFVIKADNSTEWVVQAVDHMDKKEWLSCFSQYCNFTGTASTSLHTGSKGGSLYHKVHINPCLNGSSDHTNGSSNGILQLHLPPSHRNNVPLFGESSGAVGGTGGLMLLGDTSDDTDDFNVPQHLLNSRMLPNISLPSALNSNNIGRDCLSLQEYPWFHGTLSRGTMRYINFNYCCTFYTTHFA